MTLTEKWKNGELPDGFYYFKLPDGSTDIASEYKMIRYRLTKDADKVEVLAPVPTYQEYLESESHCAVYSEVNKSLKEKNAKLKELLKECRSPINYALCLNLDEEEKIEFRNLLAKIKQAIGEK